MHEFFLPYWHDPYWKKEYTVPKPEEKAAQKKKIPQKKLNKQKLRAWEQMPQKINANKRKKNMYVNILIVLYYPIHINITRLA